MHYLKEKLTNLYEFPLRFRYVDDNFVFVSFNTDSSNLDSLINKIYPYIQLTTELENNSCLSFFYKLVSKHKKPVVNNFLLLLTVLDSNMCYIAKLCYIPKNHKTTLGFGPILSKLGTASDNITQFPS